MGYSTNKDLVEALKQGKDDALHWIFDNSSNILIAFARHTIRNPLLAEDFVQDAFCSLWENRSRLDSELSVQAYLYKLVHSRCVDYLRKQQAQSNYARKNEIILKELELTHNCFDNRIISELFASELQLISKETIGKLPPQTKEIFSLSRYQHFSNMEIAQIKGLSVKTIEYHITKALQQLKKALHEFL